MNLFANTLNSHPQRKLKINRKRTSESFGLLWAIPVLLVAVVSHLPRTNGFTIITKDTGTIAGCYHNGTLYGDGSLVPTMEPCLSCKCANRTLICSLRVCHEQPVPPPRGCVLVHHNNKCCPHLFCKRFHKRPMISDLDRKIVNFLDDFEQEQHDVAERYEGFDDYGENSLRRRSEEPDSFDEFCVQNGTIYQSGSAMTTSSLCSYCYCINGKQKCVKPKCQLPQAPAHCAPVYMEGSCCPLKYDCSGTGQAVNITASAPPSKKWSKPKPQDSGGISMEDFSHLPHKQKMHSCAIDGRVFVEGEKLPADPEEPCKICYCIHGLAKCTPKKCTPTLKNCLPIIPEGQCCPSGYKCNMAKPRQFDLFSILFGLEENATESGGAASSVESTTLPPFVPLAPLNPESTSEKSFLDVLRDGLNFVEKNGENIGDALDKSANETLTDRVEGKEEEEQQQEAVTVITVTENSSDEYFDYEENDPDDDLFHPNEEVINVTAADSKISGDHQGNGNEDPKVKVVPMRDSPMNIIKMEAITERVKPTTRRPLETTTEELEISTIKFIPSPTRAVHLATQKPPVTNGQVVEKVTVQQDPPLLAQNQVSNNSSTESLFSAFFSGLAEIFDEKFKQNGTRNGTEPQAVVKTSPSSTVVPPLPTKPHFYVTPSSIRPVPMIREEEAVVKQRPVVVVKTTTMPTTTRVPSTSTAAATRRTTPTTVKITSKIPPSTSTTTTTTLKPSTTTTPRPTTTIARISTTNKPTETTTIKPTTRQPVTKTSGFKLTNLEMKTTEETFSTQTEMVHLLTPKPLAVPPTVVKPGGLSEDSDYHFDYNEPTLPPSLPNLKIIPFLPADAVKHDRQKPYDYYNPERTSYPSITTEAYESNYGQFELGEKAIDYSNSYVKEQLSHDIIKKGDGYAQYPSITEKSHGGGGGDKMQEKSDYDYLLDGYNLKKNGHGDDYMKNNFDVDVNSYMSFKTGPVYKTTSQQQQQQQEYSGTAEITNVEMRTEPPTAFNYDLNRFSPPKETEGGFQPRNPDRFYGKYETTKYIIDITTDHPQPPPQSIKMETYSGYKNNNYIQEKKSPKQPLDPNKISITTDRNIPPMDDKDVDSMLDIIRQAEGAPGHSSILNFDATRDPENEGLLDFFSMLFKDQDSAPEKPQKSTPVQEVDFKSKLESSKEQFAKIDVPPFKSISPNFDFSNLELTTKSEYDDPLLDMDAAVVGATATDRTQPTDKNGTAIKNILLDLLGHGHNSFVEEAPKTAASTPPPATPLKFPVHSIPYIATSSLQHINPRPIEPIRNNLDSLLSNNNSSSSSASSTSSSVPSQFGILSDDLNSRHTASYVVNPLNMESLKRHQSEQPAKIYTKPLTSKSDLRLKLAGCNIYGRMYRVGSVIAELSNECLQCKCEEVGVHCTPLDC